MSDPQTHAGIPVSFQVPCAGGPVMSLVLSTCKNGAKKFEETYRFNTTGATSGSSSSTVTITGGRLPTGAVTAVGVRTQSGRGGQARVFDLSGRCFTKKQAIPGAVTVTIDRATERRAVSVPVF